ncbi:MAG: mechanosensitive ion channel [Clostridia bacterium]|nr:mechanosensitive ion channel [Clostridia bacterium]
MSSIERIKAFLQEKGGKKLAVISVIVFLIITVILFFAAFKITSDLRLTLMDEELSEVPKIVESLKNELNIRSHAYEEEVKIRAEFGLILYANEDGLTDEDRLVRVRDVVSAKSVSVIDGQKQLVSTTGYVSPEKNFRAGLEALEPYVIHLEIYSSNPEDVETAELSDGQGFIMVPIPGTAQHSMVFEFPCDLMLELYNAFETWSSVLEHMLSGEEGIAFAKNGDMLTGYPLSSFTSDQAAQIREEMTKVFESSSFRSTGNERSTKTITLLGERYLAARVHLPQEDTDIILTVPQKEVVRNSIFIAAAMSAICGWGMVLIQIYIYTRLLREKDMTVTKLFSLKRLCRKTWPGILAVLVVTVLFSSMLLQLENRTNSTYAALTKRLSLEHEIDWRKAQEDEIRKTFMDSYRIRAEILAEFLMAYPAYQTHAHLVELNRFIRADYLMCFDSTGQERISSNSYTGFSVGGNLSEEYRAVLMGYPSAVVDPAQDPYTGQLQIGTAILMKDKEGKADGFLLVVNSAEALTEELKRTNFENTVNSYPVQEGQFAAVINNEDGRFIAHSDPKMIGQKAADVIENYTPASSFEGFIHYNNAGVCVSANELNGMTLLYMVSESGYSAPRTVFIPAVLTVVLILALVYYLAANLLIAQTMAEAKGEMQQNAGQGASVMIFFDGYVVFMTLFAVSVLIASSGGWWTTFDYVFSWKWSKGVHLFSAWALLFILTVYFFWDFLARKVMNFLEDRISLRSKTVTRLVKSRISYTAIISLIFCILDMFGVNTTAILASAGIISIAAGMGAQSMASDLLAGFFMMLEGSVHVGDRVSVSGITGCVTDMGIRTTEITDDEGNVVILNNSRVSGVCNMSMNHARREPENDRKNKK